MDTYSFIVYIKTDNISEHIAEDVQMVLKECNHLIQ